MKDFKVSVVGLGKLGSSLSACFASRGYEVLGYDINEANNKNFNKGKPPINETDLDKYFRKYKSKFKSSSLENVILNTNISFIVIPTPSSKNGSFSAKYANDVFSKISKILKKKKDYHLFVLVSTVLPGTSRNILLQKFYDNKVFNFGYCYSPAFIALGQIIKDFLEPDFLLIGQLDKKSGTSLRNFYESIYKKSMNYRIMSLESAEITKLSVNTYITNKISYANMISEVAQRIPFTNIDDITSAIGSDSRIGNKYLKAGLGFAGPCFPRDNKAISFIGKKIGADTSLALTTEKFNLSLNKNNLKKYLKYFKKREKVAVLGLSYKPNTNSLDESQSLDLSNLLSKNKYKVFCHDKKLNTIDKKPFDKKIVFKKHLKQCIKNSKCIFITKDEQIYRDITPKSLKNKIVIDFWRILKNKKLDKSTTYFSHGDSFNNFETKMNQRNIVKNIES